jgi:hypothetical protein
MCVCVCVSELFLKSQNKRCSTRIPLYGSIWFQGLELTLIRDMCGRRSYTLRHEWRWVGGIKGVGVFDRERERVCFCVRDLYDEVERRFLTLTEGEK